MKRVMSGVAFCEQFSSTSGPAAKRQKAAGKAPGKPGAPAMPAQEDYLRMIDMVFENAGLEDGATDFEVEQRLGEAGLRTVLMFYELATASGKKQPLSHSALTATSKMELSSSESEAACVPDSEDSSSSGDAAMNEFMVPGTLASFKVGKKSSKQTRRVSARLSQAAVVPVLSSAESSEVAVLPPRPPSAEAKGASKKYKAETEIALSRIFQLGSVADVEQPDIEPYAPYDGPNVLTMTGFGELGRWGNQILQYAFLRCAAEKSGAQIQVPYWVGTDLFELDNSRVVRRLPSVIEDRTRKANSTFTDEFMEYIQASNAGQNVEEVFDDVLDTSKPDVQLANVDVWGWFQWHSSVYAPHKQLIMDTFTPAADVREHFDQIISSGLRTAKSGKTTLVGLHLRLGDYKNISASSFGYCAPTSWYLEWLAEIWPTLENPVLFVASDEVDTVLRDFAAYNPITSEMLNAKLPESRASLGAGFFPDWYILSQCDVLAISNSSFSFTACMLNRQPGARFFRAHYSDFIVEFDPWNADPIVHRPEETNALRRIGSTLSILYNTQGAKGVVKNVLDELPVQGIRSIVMKAVLRARALRAIEDQRASARTVRA
ncbi:hypothetical protein FVE85_3263 [Porphyridium purpureum]|uniref:Fucosyltransferase n=1 Tax=Porphyridium purpureum TaxID=35688 RepID=A0A5J4YW37_PORPP|nr:hypothetical protein FVE85_3263 [Porphyridium purpureum]|eukprot:POR6179..scf227_4